jgi:hypothetical protein
MPLVLIVTPGHPLPESVRAALEAVGQPYVLVCNSRGRWYCPVCASCAEVRGAEAGKMGECYGCFTDFACAVSPSGALLAQAEVAPARK